MPRIISQKKGTYLVESFTTKDKFYEVDLRWLIDGTCNCPAFKKSGIFCKHIKEVKSRLEDKMVGIENE